jgi:c-di-GMP-binding flagellar brake protein YcgR
MDMVAVLMGYSVRVSLGVFMISELVMLRGAEPRKILELMVERKVPAVMSYLSRDRWHIARVQPSCLGAGRFEVALSPRKEPHPINIQPGEAVGISFKYEYGKFIFETTVLELEPSQDRNCGGVIVLSIPDRIEMVQRRSYFRVNVPAELKVNVTLWPRSRTRAKNPSDVLSGFGCDGGKSDSGSSWQGRLADVSAGGAQIIVDAKYKDDFKTGQFLGLKFTPLPYEAQIMFNAQIRSILPTADEANICLGLQIVGLEASPEGRFVLRRLCEIVERYYQISKSSAKQQDLRQSPVVSVSK